MMSKQVKCELYNDHNQNYKKYGIPKAQLIIAARCGNSVSPVLAEALVKANFN